MNTPQTSAKKLSIGLVGLDTSHVIAYARMMNDPEAKERVPGGKITIGYPGASQDFPLSRDRVDGFTRDLAEKYAVKIVDSPEAVAQSCDMIFLTSADGRKHLDFFRRIVSAKKPVFIDKPLACTSADAKEIVRLAKEAGVPIMSCSSVRFDAALESTVDRMATETDNPILGVQVFGPVRLAPPTPHLFWYGIHTVEMAMRVLGPGCQSVHCLGWDQHDLLSLRWKDGRAATIHGNRGGTYTYGATIHREKGPTRIDMDSGGRSSTARMTDAVMASLPNGKTAVPINETLEIMRILEAADESRESGKIVTI